MRKKAIFFLARPRKKLFSFGFVSAVPPAHPHHSTYPDVPRGKISPGRGGNFPRKGGKISLGRGGLKRVDGCMAMQHEEQKGLGVLRWVFFSSSVSSPPLFLRQLSIAHHANCPKNTSLLLAFKWRCWWMHGDATSSLFPLAHIFPHRIPSPLFPFARIQHPLPFSIARPPTYHQSLHSELGGEEGL